MTFSYHVHSIFSDGKDSIEEIAAKAKKDNIEAGLSDHYILDPRGKVYAWGMKKELLEDYLNEVAKNQLLVGLEVDFFEESLKELTMLSGRKEFDYLIGSVHVVDGTVVVDSGDFYNQSIARRYWEKVKKMAESSLFDIVGHMDVIKKHSTVKPEFEEMDFIEESLYAIKRANMAVEVNTSGWHHRCNEQFPSNKILLRIKELDIPIVVTADAHKKEHLTRSYGDALSLLSKMGFTKQVKFKKRNFSFVDFLVK